MHESPAVVTRVPRISRPLAVFRRRAARKSSPFRLRPQMEGPVEKP